jgi:uncharacterized membrane protein YuzA (DUF378 family)
MVTTVAHPTHRSADTLTWIAFWLMVVGGINWGLVGFFDVDLVAAIFGARSPASRVVYSLVGLCTLYCAFAIPVMHRRVATAAV